MQICYFESQFFALLLSLKNPPTTFIILNSLLLALTFPPLFGSPEEKHFNSLVLNAVT